MPELDQPTDDAPATAPATPANPETGAMDFEKFRTELMTDIKSEMDNRFSGFQSIIDKRDKKWDKYAQTMEELKNRSLSDDEREQLEQRAGQEEFAALKAENELLKLGKEFEPEVVETFTKLLSAETPREQLEIMRSFRTGAAPEQPAGDPTPPVKTGTPSAPVDLNNPVSDDPVDGSNWEAQFEKDPSLVDRILKRL